MKIKNLLKKMWLLYIVFIICSFFICCSCSEPVLLESTIVGKQYVPEQTSYGIIVTNNGQPGMTFNSSDEEYIIFVMENDEPKKIRCKAKTYFKLKKFQRVKYWKKWYGRFLIE